MTGKETLPVQVKIVEAVERTGLGTARQVGLASGVSTSTVRHVLFTLTALGVMERNEHFKGYACKLSPHAASNPYYSRLIAHKAVRS